MDVVGFLFGLGLVQGLVLAAVLLTIPSDHKTANRLMAAMVIIMALSLLQNWLGRSGTWNDYPQFAVLIRPFYFTLGPLLYLYAYSLTGGKLRLQQTAHFLPALFILISINASYWQLEADQQRQIINEFLSARGDLVQSQLVREVIPPYLRLWIDYPLFSLLYLPQFGLYCLLVIHTIGRHTRNLEQHFSSLESMNLRWLRALTVICLIYILLFMVANRGPALLIDDFDPTSIGLYVHAILLVLLVYGIAAVALFQPSLISGVKQALDSKPPVAPAAIEADPDHSDSESPVTTEPQKEKAEKYARSRLSMEDAQRYKVRIMEVMQEEELYLDSDLTLPDLAKACELSAPQISQLINVEMGQNFFSFVNNYRIQLARRMLSDPETAQMPIVELALEVGFKSKSSFYDAFKRITGMTPTQFKQAIK